jgi:hypothetical protein
VPLSAAALPPSDQRQVASNLSEHESRPPGRRSYATEPHQSRTAKWPPSWRISRDASRAETPSLPRLRSAAIRVWVRCRCWSLRLRFRWNRARSPFRSDIPLRYPRNQDGPVPFRTHSEPDRAAQSITRHVTPWNTGIAQPQPSPAGWPGPSSPADSVRQRGTTPTQLERLARRAYSGPLAHGEGTSCAPATHSSAVNTRMAHTAEARNRVMVEDYSAVPKQRDFVGRGAAHWRASPASQMCNSTHVVPGECLILEEPGQKGIACVPFPSSRCRAATWCPTQKGPRPR